MHTTLFPVTAAAALTGTIGPLAPTAAPPPITTRAARRNHHPELLQRSYHTQPPLQPLAGHPPKTLQRTEAKR